MSEIGSGPDPQLDAVIFDLGGVVLRWDPRAAYAQVLPEDEIDAFLDEISFPEWNHAHDAGQDWSVGENELIARFPHRAEVVGAYRRHFPLVIPAMVAGTAAVIAELSLAGVRLLALTNWAADTFAETRDRFDILKRFESIMVSGEEKLAKPDPAIFSRLVERAQLDPARTLFVDDSATNCEAAAGIGLQTRRFLDAETLRDDLIRCGLLGPATPPSAPIFHLTTWSLWREAELAGDYAWSSRGLRYQQAGFVHCSFADQVAGVRQRIFGDLADADLAVLRLDPSRLSGPVLVEDLRPRADRRDDSDRGFPHLYGELRPDAVAEVLDWSDSRILR